MIVGILIGKYVSVVPSFFGQFEYANVSVPWNTLFLSVVLFVVIPLVGGILTRIFIVKSKGLDYFENTFVKKFDDITTIGLLLTLVLIFLFQGDVIIENPLHILLIAVPLILQTFLIVSIGRIGDWKIRLEKEMMYLSK